MDVTKGFCLKIFKFYIKVQTESYRKNLILFRRRAGSAWCSSSADTAGKRKREKGRKIQTVGRHHQWRVVALLVRAMLHPIPPPAKTFPLSEGNNSLLLVSIEFLHRIVSIDNVIITIITTCINNTTPSHDIAMYQWQYQDLTNLNATGNFCKNFSCNIQNLNAADIFQFLQNFPCTFPNVTCNQNFVIVIIYWFHAFSIVSSERFHMQHIFLKR